MTMAAKDPSCLTDTSAVPSLPGIPRLVESRDEEDENADDDEVMVVFEQEESTKDSSLESWGEQSFSFTGWDGIYSSNDSRSPIPGYSQRELAQKVTVVQSKKDSITGNFVKVQHTLQSCLEQNYEEFEPKVRAKSWYFHYLYGKKMGIVYGQTVGTVERLRNVMEKRSRWKLVHLI